MEDKSQGKKASTRSDQPEAAELQQEVPAPAKTTMIDTTAGGAARQPIADEQSYASAGSDDAANESEDDEDYDDFGNKAVGSNDDEADDADMVSTAQREFDLAD